MRMPSMNPDGCFYSFRFVFFWNESAGISLTDASGKHSLYDVSCKESKPSQNGCNQNGGMKTHPALQKTISYQLKVICFQLSALSFQLRSTSYQLRAASYPPSPVLGLLTEIASLENHWQSKSY